MTFGFYLSYAWRSLRRGGQRSALAVTCISFGVLSLVALQQLAEIIDGALLVSPRYKRGGDMILARTEGGINTRDQENLSTLGIESHTSFVLSQAQLMKTERSGHVTMVTQALGIDPSRFPLYGDFVLKSPLEVSLSEVLAPIGSAVITRDLATSAELAIGDTFSLVGDPKVPPFPLKISGIAAQTPDRLGSSVYFSIETARERGIGKVTHLAARHDSPETVRGRLESAGWKVTVLEDASRTQESELFQFMLAGAGILGLLIGGIGAANTMQVLLARRTEEIATLKTLGFRQVHLLSMFGIESALLGILGGVFGVGLGLVVAKFFMNLLGGVVPFLLTYRVQPTIVIGGLLVGVLTALIFGLVTIVRAAGVRPASILRDTIAPVRGYRRIATFGLYAGLLVLFAGLCSVILGSLQKGFGVVAAGLLGLLCLGLGLGAVLFLVVRILVTRFPLLAMARRNLRQEPARAIYGLVALFVGVYAIGFAGISLLNAGERFSDRQMDLSGINTRVYGSTECIEDLEQAIREQGVEEFWINLSAEADIYASSDSLPGSFNDIVGRRDKDILRGLTLVDSLEVRLQESAYVLDRIAKRRGLAIGDTLRLENDHGSATVRLAGIFKSESGFISAPPRALVVPEAVARRLSPAVLPITISLAADPDRLEEINQRIGEAVPSSVVIGTDTISDFVNATFSGLFWFAISVAALALVAGAVLIANAVGLSMLERRRELGILKAVGFGSREVLWTVLLENGLLGAISGTMGVLVLLLTVVVLNLRFPSAQLSLKPEQAFILILVSMAFAIGSALCVAWRPTHVRPLEVLRGA